MAYLDHLISLPLATLNKEPTLISAEAATVESELTNLCYREYSTFLSVHRCSAAVRSAFDDFQGSLDNLLDSVPVLEDECRLFAKRTQGLSTSRNRSILVQENQDKLLDLLELPQLMETCVRNGYYQEAMELANHARDLQSRYSGNRLVCDTAKEVDSVNQLMLAQLFSLLREPVKLSTAMKTVSYLRRMDVMDEASLGLAFLSGRLYNFRTQLLQIEKDRAEPVRYLRRYIDSFREHVYDILSQHSAMFDDFDGLVSFAGQCVTDLVELVQSYIPRIAHDPASLSSVLIQLGYCSLSFARIGLDFAPLIAAPFADTVLATYSHAVAAASDKLAGTLKAAADGQGIPTDALVDAEQRAAVLASPPRFASGADAPPHGLAAFPPVAWFVNDNVAALNSLRLLAPTTLASQLVHTLAQRLAADTGAVLAFLRDSTVSTTVNGDRPGHKRTPSSPRAQLLRRNTETQLTPAARAAKRHESRQLGVVIAEVWLGVVNFLLGALEVEVLGGFEVGVEPDLAAKLDAVKAWIAANRVDEVRGDVAVESVASAGGEPVTAQEAMETTTAEGERAASTVESDQAASNAEDVFGPRSAVGEMVMGTALKVSAAADTAAAGAVGEHAAAEETAAYAVTTDTAAEDTARAGVDDTGNAGIAEDLKAESTVVEPMFQNAPGYADGAGLSTEVLASAPVVIPHDLDPDERVAGDVQTHVKPTDAEPQDGKADGADLDVARTEVDHATLDKQTSGEHTETPAADGVVDAGVDGNGAAAKAEARSGVAPVVQSAQPVVSGEGTNGAAGADTEEEASDPAHAADASGADGLATTKPGADEPDITDDVASSTRPSTPGTPADRSDGGGKEEQVKPAGSGKNNNKKKKKKKRS